MKISTEILKIDSNAYRVYQKEKNTILEDGNAYLLSPLNDYVYPYRGEITTYKHAMLPGIYSIKGSKHVYVKRPSSEADMLRYAKERTFTLTLDNIFTKLLPYDVTDSPAYVINEDNLFIPEIYPTDDIALAGAKYCMKKKRVDFNIYSHKFPSQIMKNNMRRLLSNGGGTLKMDMAERWGDITGVNIGVMFWDRPGDPHPMNKDSDKLVIYYNTKEDLDLEEIKSSIEFVKIKYNEGNIIKYNGKESLEEEDYE